MPDCLSCIHCVWRVIDSAYNKDYVCEYTLATIPVVTCNNYKEKPYVHISQNQ